MLDREDCRNRRSAAFLTSACHFGGSERADWHRTRRGKRSPDFLQDAFHFYFTSSCSTRIERRVAPPPLHTLAAMHDIPQRGRVTRYGERIDHEQQCRPASSRREARRSRGLLRAGSAGARNTRVCRRPSRAAVRNARGRRQNDESMREDSRNGTLARQEHHLESRRTIRALSRTITARPEHSLDIEHHAHIGRRTRSSRIARRAPDGPEKKKPRKSENLRGFVTAFGGDGDRQMQAQADPFPSKYLPTIQSLAQSNHPIYANSFQPHPAFSDGLNDRLEDRC